MWLEYHFKKKEKKKKRKKRALKGVRMFTENCFSLFFRLKICVVLPIAPF